MEKALKLYTYIDGGNDAPFPNSENQIEILWKTAKEPVKYASTGDYAKHIHDKLFEKYDKETCKKMMNF